MPKRKTLDKKFATGSCGQCKCTEIYKAETSALGNILDILGNGHSCFSVNLTA